MHLTTATGKVFCLLLPAPVSTPAPIQYSVLSTHKTDGTRTPIVSKDLVGEAVSLQRMIEDAQRRLFEIQAHQQPSQPENKTAARKPRAKRFPCDHPDCGKAFRTKYDLEVHTRTHTGARPFECPFPDCGKAFSQAAGRVRHMRVHTGEKPYTCPYCSKAFSESCHRNRHAASSCPQNPHPLRSRPDTGALQSRTELLSSQQSAQ
eukprot:c14631_g1_i3.p1 GENE.c14631_g1_i3~~c14631_g1_i3.p1  ORF type:complete len:213 (+),score=18.40 c14631_g1_i3:27-641(+)